MRAVVLALLIACGGSSTSEPVTGSGDQLMDRVMAAMEAQLGADAVAVSKRTFASDREAEDALAMLTPASFTPRPEFFKAVFDEGSGQGPDKISRALSQQLADYAAAHPDEMQQRGEAMIKRLEPVMKAAFDNVQRQRH